MSERMRKVSGTAVKLRLVLAAFCISLTNLPVPAPRADSLEGPALYPLMRGSQKDGDRKFGFVDATGRLVIPAQYDWANKFIEGREPR
jgi:hypothetical protein